MASQGAFSRSNCRADHRASRALPSGIPPGSQRTASPGRPAPQSRSASPEGKTGGGIASRRSTTAPTRSRSRSQYGRVDLERRPARQRPAARRGITGVDLGRAAASPRLDPFASEVAPSRPGRAAPKTDPEMRRAPSSSSTAPSRSPAPPPGRPPAPSRARSTAVVGYPRDGGAPRRTGGSGSRPGRAAARPRSCGSPADPGDSGTRPIGLPEPQPEPGEKQSPIVGGSRRHGPHGAPGSVVEPARELVGAGLVDRQIGALLRIARPTGSDAVPRDGLVPATLAEGTTAREKGHLP